MKRVTENHETRRVAIAILHYLRDYPSAKDSGRGIAKWWVNEEREVVEKALALLVTEGVMEKRLHVYQFVQTQPAAESRNSIDQALRRLRRQNKS